MSLQGTAGHSDAEYIYSKKSNVQLCTL